MRLHHHRPRRRADGCNLAAAQLRAGDREPQHHFPHPDAGVRRGPDRADPGRDDPRQPGRESSTREAAAADQRPGRTATATTAPSRASAGRRRTSRCCCSPARPTTSRWESPTSCSSRSATQTPRLPVRHGSQRHAELRGAATALDRHHGDPELRQLPALPRAADAVQLDTRADRRRSAAGKSLFSSVGCALCHTPTLKTGNSTVARAAQQGREPVLRPSAARHGRRAWPTASARAQPGRREFRTAPLWGLGQRIFFLHDGRTYDLRVAIREHASDGSEANGSSGRFNDLRESQKQDLLNFLRSL